MGTYKLRKLECPSCQTIVEGNFNKTRKYCSRKCYDTTRPLSIKNPVIDKLCEVCNSTFETKNNEQKYCSANCQNKWQSRNKTMFVCKICDIEFGLSKSLADSREYEVKFCSIKCRNKDEDWQKSPTLANIAQQNKTGPNRLELAGRDILNEIGIKFDEQVLIADRCLVDVFIPERGIVIQWDGDYWHGHPNSLKNETPDKRQKQRMHLDKIQDEYMKKCGYVILRFWEHEVKNNKNKVYEDIRRAIQ